jgi:hypothetical protein
MWLDLLLLCLACGCDRSRLVEDTRWQPASRWLSSHLTCKQDAAQLWLEQPCWFLLYYWIIKLSPCKTKAKTTHGQVSRGYVRTETCLCALLMWQDVYISCANELHYSVTSPDRSQRRSSNVKSINSVVGTPNAHLKEQWLNDRKIKLRDPSPQANYTDRATSAFEDRRCRVVSSTAF